MRLVKFVSVSTVMAVLAAGAAFGQATDPVDPVDPGVQAASRGTGAALSSVSSDSGLQAFFTDGLNRFQAVESVSGTANVGLGPRFNFNACAGCHAAPAVGGTGPSVNPQVAGVGSCSNGVSGLSQTATLVSAGQQTAAQKGTIACNNTNTIPSFLTANGPTREARFPFFFSSNGEANTNAPNGGVETIFVVSGRPDGATNCSLSQPSFAAAASANNLIFRIPTPTFGLGLVENLDDSTLLNNQASNLNNNDGVTGTFNHNGNDGTISRFGWKAQNKSLHIFSGEAYNVEMGISNLLFTQDRPLPGEDGNGPSAAGEVGLPSTCLNLAGIGYPEDTNNPDVTSIPAVLDDVSAFANFMRLLAPPPTGGVVLSGSAVSSSAISAGKSLFSSVGCSICHNPTPGTTQASGITSSLSQQTVNSFSDFEIHTMGTFLEDNVSQGGANGEQFRTAPLWGLGQRIFLLHDGRTTNLLTAIEDHSSSGSEANTVISNFNDLSSTQQQEILDFLRSL